MHEAQWWHQAGDSQETLHRGKVSRLSIGCQVERKGKKVKARKYSLGKEMVTGNI